MVRLAVVFAFLSAVGAARVQVDTVAAEAAAEVVAEATAEAVAEDSVDAVQWACPIGERRFRTHRNDGRRNLCATVMSTSTVSTRASVARTYHGAATSWCVIQFHDGVTEDVHPMHLRHDQASVQSCGRRFPNPVVFRNADSGRRLYAQSGDNEENGVGAASGEEIHEDQQWVIEVAGPSDPDQFTITNYLSDRRLFARSDAVGAGPYGPEVVPEDQRWYIEPDGPDGAFLLFANNARLLFARSGRDMEQGFGSTTWESTIPDNQKWYIDPNREFDNPWYLPNSEYTPQ